MLIVHIVVKLLIWAITYLYYKGQPGFCDLDEVQSICTKSYVDDILYDTINVHIDSTQYYLYMTP